jgi:methylthioribose-1-phosphate isomerase
MGCRSYANAISVVNSVDEKIKMAKKTAIEIADEDAENCRMIGRMAL